MPRTLNDIIPPSRRRQMEAQQPSAPSSFGEPTPPPAPPLQRPVSPRAPRGGGRRFPWGTAVIALVVVALSVGALMAFSGARVEVAPATNAAYVSADFTATRGTGDLPFEVVTIDKTVSKGVPAEATETGNDPAQGTITIYNKQTESQQLIRNTRFQSPDGLVFRIRESVTVPAGSANAPGTATATVFAEEGGERYNIGPSRFTVPGLAGSDAFDLVYAESTTAMTGGFSGTRPTVSDITIEAQTPALRSALESELRTAVLQGVPQGYVLVPGAYQISYEELPDTPGEGNTVNVQMKGTMTAVVFPNAALARAIAFQVVGTYSGQAVTLQSVEGLVARPASSESPNASDTYTFNLTGNAPIVWDIDEPRIAGAVAGKSRDSARVVLQGFPEVDEALIVLRPFWAQTFPQDPEKIDIVVKTGDEEEGE